jgi:hypothetical protein
MNEELVAAHARGALDPARVRLRGNDLQYRRRLRDTRCPGCGSVGLDRARRLEAVERRGPMIRNL